MCLANDTAGFDTSRPGASEAKWAAWADRLPLWNSGARQLVIVSPHPDDEIPGAGGLLAQTQALHECVRSDDLILAPVPFDGHPDHEVAGRAAWRVARDRGLAPIRYPIWAWHLGSTRLRSASRAVRFPLTERTKLAKHRAINQFKSQTSERPGGAIIRKQVLAYFIRSYEVFLL